MLASVWTLSGLVEDDLAIPSTSSGRKMMGAICKAKTRADMQFVETKRPE
jgi:hypothetical protein